MRRSLGTAATAAIAVAVAAAPASASADVTGTFGVTSKTPGASSGFTLDLAQDPAAPKVVKRLVLRFPPGTKLDPQGAVQCTASREERTAKGHAAACPAASEVGKGSGEAKAGETTIVAQQTIWNVLAGAFPVLNVENSANGQLLGAISGVFKGRNLDFEQVDLAITKLDLDVGARTTGTGRKQRALIRTPAACPASRSWRTRVEVTYADGSKSKLDGTSPCQRQKKPKKPKKG